MSLDPLAKKVTVGIVSSAEEVDSQRLVKGIGEALRKYSATVILPYSAGDRRKVDVVAKISVRSEHKGSVWNFFVDFPGFLVWAPAWNGYVYRVNYDVDVLLTSASDGRKLDSWSQPIRLNVRHADATRTWTELSWLEVGAAAFVGGLLHIRYDEGVSPLVSDKIGIPIGDYIAQEIVTRLNRSWDFSQTRDQVLARPLVLLSRPAQE